MEFPAVLGVFLTHGRTRGSTLLGPLMGLLVGRLVGQILLSLAPCDAHVFLQWSDDDFHGGALPAPSSSP